ncbi:MAG TPA: hypothetical protein VJN63_12270 [Thermoplasmata archaeon]|nr:hypothetical protein [Thermoplasmata archaeon]
MVPGGPAPWRDLMLSRSGVRALGKMRPGDVAIASLALLVAAAVGLLVLLLRLL